MQKPWFPVGQRLCKDMALAGNNLQRQLLHSEKLNYVSNITKLKTLISDFRISPIYKNQLNSFSTLYKVAIKIKNSVPQQRG